MAEMFNGERAPPSSWLALQAAPPAQLDPVEGGPSEEERWLFDTAGELAMWGEVTLQYKRLHSYAGDLAPAGDTSVSSRGSYTRAKGPGASAHAGAFHMALSLNLERIQKVLDGSAARRGAKGSCETPGSRDPLSYQP